MSSKKVSKLEVKKTTLAGSPCDFPMKNTIIAYNKRTLSTGCLLVQVAITRCGNLLTDVSDIRSIYVTSSAVTGNAG
jgi:hypothetical protein